MKWLSIVSGAVLILVALKDLFHTLFHPASSGHVSDWISLRLWRIFRTLPAKRMNSAGPIIFIAIIAYWTASIVFGFALIYRPYLPHGFDYMYGVDPRSYDSFLEAINISLGCLITQFVGASAKLPWLQLLSTLESIFGFAILTASISWILSIYPVIEHRRSLAHEASLLHYGEATGDRPLESLNDDQLQTILMGLATQLTTHRNELTQFPITYYFFEDEKKTALPGVIPYMSELADRFMDRQGAVRLAAITLGGAVNDYVEVIAQDFLKRDFASKKEAILALARDHRRQPVHSPEKEEAPARIA